MKYRNLSPSQWVRMAFVALLLAASLSAWAQLTTTAQYLYASGSKPDFSGGLIAGYRVASDGTLTLTQNPFPTSERVNMTLPSAQGAKLFALGAHKLWVFAVNPTNGTISLLSSVVFPSNIVGTFMAINPASSLLFVAKDVDPGTTNEVRRITTYRVNSNGTVTAIASAVVAGFIPSLTVDPTGRYLYAREEGSNFAVDIAQFAINSTTGSLTFVSTTATNDSSPGVGNVLQATSRSLYYGLGTPEVSIFGRNTTTGRLTFIETVICDCDAGPDFGGPIALNAKGTILFEGTGQDAGIAVYTVDQTTGLLTPNRGSFIPFTTGPFPFTPDRAGNLLFGFDELANRINGYTVSDVGTVAATAQGSIAAPDMNIATLQVVAVKR